MTTPRKKVTKAGAQVNNETGTVSPGEQRADIESPMLALLPSAAELRQMVARPAQDTSFLSSDANLGPALDIPPALLNPLASLPRPISLDEVKESVSAADSAGKPQTR